MTVTETLSEINRTVAERVGLPVKEQESYDVLKRVMQAVIDDPKTNLKKREELSVVMRSGMLDKKEIVTDETKSAAFMEELNKEIQKAIKDGRLPHPSKDPFVQKMKKLWRKTKKK